LPSADQTDRVAHHPYRSLQAHRRLAMGLALHKRIEGSPFSIGVFSAQDYRLRCSLTHSMSARRPA
jgi:hypothetical protein